MSPNKTELATPARRLDPFETTPWSLVVAMQRSSDQTIVDRLMEELAERYWPPVYAYLRQSGRSINDSQDLSQAFFTDVVLGRRLLERADPERGRLRVLIKSSLKRFLIDDHRYRSTTGRRLILTDQQVLEQEHAIQPLDASSADEAFERQWVSVVLELAMKQCEEHYKSTGRSQYWEAYVTLEFLPHIHGTRRLSNQQVAEDLGFRTAADVSNAVRLVKSRLRVLIREVVYRSADGEAERAAEFSYLTGMLGG